MGKHRKKCCERWRRKPKACKSCPLFEDMGKKARKKLLRRLRLGKAHP